ncbi:MAG: hypothetical protein LBF59_07460 [Prevotellaceae bacterium]|nr:hypothetical protein [Prevotellaceae bacterium]
MTSPDIRSQLAVRKSETDFRQGKKVHAGLRETSGKVRKRLAGLRETSGKVRKRLAGLRQEILLRKMSSIRRPIASPRRLWRCRKSKINRKERKGIRKERKGEGVVENVVDETQIMTICML